MEMMHNSRSILQNIDLPKSCRVTITILANGENSTFTGVLHSVDQTTGKITLKNVATAGSKLCGTQIYYCKDIVDMHVESDVQDTPSSPTKVERSKQKQVCQSRKHVPRHLSRLKNVDDDALILSNILRDELGNQGTDSEDDDFEDFYKTENYTLICRVCDKFYDAIEYIMDQQAIGVSFEGQKLGRDGILSLLQIATDSELIVFDILRLGGEAFKAGLQAVFEADNVMKVIHDCRFVADLLRYQYNTSMGNIFDTQVANAFVYRISNEGDWPRFVESLPGCLLSYLKLSPQEVQFTQVRERCKEKDEAVWLVRPLPEKLLDAATKNTVHLLKLQQVLLVEMLAEFKAAVGIYLNHVSGTVEDVEKCRVTSHLLPIAFTYIHKYVNNNSHNRGRVDPQCFSRKGFRENNVTVPSKTMIFSHDSPWHKIPYRHSGGFSQSGNSEEKQTESKMTGIPAEEKGRPPRKSPQPQRSAHKHKNKKQMSAGSEQSSFENKPQVESVGASDVNSITKYLPEAKSHGKKDHDQNECSTAVCGRTVSDAEPGFCNATQSDSEKTRMSKVVSVSDSDIRSDTQAVGQMVQKSGLWRMSMESKKQTPGCTFHPSNISPLKQLTSSSTCQDSQMSVTAYDVSEQEEAEELKRKMALLDQLHFVPATATAAAKNNVPQQKHTSGQQSRSSSSSSRSSQSHDIPKLITAAQGPGSLGSSDSSSEGSRPPGMFSEVSLERGNMLGSSTFMPAGMQEVKTRRLKKKRQECSGNKTCELAQTTTNPGPKAAKELDFSLIPTPQSLSQRKEQALGVSSIGIGNPFSDDEGFITPSKMTLNGSLQCRFTSRGGGGNDETISDNELDKLLKSDKSQRILKLASLNPSTNVRDKILPLPDKAKSPQCGNS